MKRIMLKSKIHRATLTGVELDPAENWHDSVPVCFDLMPTDGWLKSDKQHSPGRK